MHQILAYGLGVDSTAMLCIHLYRDDSLEIINRIRAGRNQPAFTREKLDEMLPHFEAAVFSDTGAELPHTYDNLEVSRKLCEEAGLPLIVVNAWAGRADERSDGKIDSWHKARGVVPFFNGAKHTCSKIWKQMPMHKWADSTFGDEPVMWSVGIAADEGARLAKYKGVKQKFDASTNSRYPMTDLGITREDEQAILDELWPMKVRLSACYFCPYNTEDDMKELLELYPEIWAKTEDLEQAFFDASTSRYEAWVEAGKPLVKFGLTKAGEQKYRAPSGMWRDDYANRKIEPQRLMQRTSPNGGLMSAKEWKDYIQNGTVATRVKGQSKLSKWSCDGVCF